MSTNSLIDPNINIDHIHFTNVDIMSWTDIFSAPIIESDMLQTTQHDDALGGNVATTYFGYQPLLPFAMPSLQTLQEIEVPHVAKCQSYTEHESVMITSPLFIEHLDIVTQNFETQFSSVKLPCYYPYHLW